MEMDEAEAEAAAGNEVVTPTESQATTGQRPEFPNQAVDVTPDPRPGPSAFVAAVHKSTGDAEAPGKDDTAGRQPTTASDPTQKSDTEANQVLERLDPPHDQIQIRSTQQKQEPVDEVNTVEMSEAGSQAVKRLLSETPSLDHAEEERKLQLRWKEAECHRRRTRATPTTFSDHGRLIHRRAHRGAALRHTTPATWLLGRYERHRMSRSWTRRIPLDCLGGKHQPIKARSLLFAAHGKCFQDTSQQAECHRRRTRATPTTFSDHGRLIHRRAHRGAALRHTTPATWLLGRYERHRMSRSWTRRIPLDC
ncbi:hypothetical protein ISCGN_022473 [Ixodes scapularis]